MVPRMCVLIVNVTTDEKGGENRLKIEPGYEKLREYCDMMVESHA